MTIADAMLIVETMEMARQVTMATSVKQVKMVATGKAVEMAVGAKRVEMDGSAKPVEMVELRSTYQQLS